MYLNDLQRNWDEFGRDDPLWAILTYDEKRGNRWGVEEFFETGRKEVEALMEYIGSLRINLIGGKVLDFGCGVGRVTQALCTYFDECYGVDIAPSMIERASQYNRHGDRCHYMINVASDLAIFPDWWFDFVYSIIVLQHMKPEYALSYIKEFIRILRPTGILIFQLPSAKLKYWQMPWKSLLKELIKGMCPPRILSWLRYVRRGSRAFMEGCWVDREDVVAFIENNGGKVVDIVDDRGGGPCYKSYRYCVLKQDQSV